jgi:hypothetical protein
MSTDESLPLEAALREVFTGLAAGANQISEVADRLEAAEVTGLRSSANCPMAHYATKVLQDQGMLGLPNAWVALWYGTGLEDGSSVGLVEGCVRNNPLRTPLTPKVILPPILYEFARAFDRGEFPVLESSSN